MTGARLATLRGLIRFKGSRTIPNAVSGVCSDGLKTTVLPPPSAGASFQAIIISG